jgi:transcriptional antiterminator RfaH
MIECGAPVVPESHLEAGVHVRVRSGPLAGHEGTVLRRRGDTRLLVAVRFLQQGASVQIDECDLERLD